MPKRADRETNFDQLCQFLFGFDKVFESQRARTEIREKNRQPRDAGEHWKFHYDTATASPDGIVAYLVEETTFRLDRLLERDRTDA